MTKSFSLLPCKLSTDCSITQISFAESTVTCFLLPLACFSSHTSARAVSSTTNAISVNWSNSLWYPNSGTDLSGLKIGQCAATKKQIDEWPLLVLVVAWPPFKGFSMVLQCSLSHQPSYGCELGPSCQGLGRRSCGKQHIKRKGSQT